MQGSPEGTEGNLLAGLHFAGGHDEAGKLAVGGQAVQEEGMRGVVTAIWQADDADLRREQLQPEFEPALTGGNAAHQADVDAARFARLQGDYTASADVPFVALDETDAKAIGAFIDQRPFARLEGAGVMAAGGIERAPGKGIAVEEGDDFVEAANQAGTGLELGSA